MKELVMLNKFKVVFRHKEDSSLHEFEIAFELGSDIIEQAWEHYEKQTWLVRYDVHTLYSIIPDTNMVTEIPCKTEIPTIKGESMAAMITALTDCYSSIDDGSTQHKEMKRLARTRLVNILNQNIEIE